MPLVAIHQPNFFPWLGYFDKIARSDHFVFLDHVQFPKTGGIWSNRVRLMVSGTPEWVTAPIVRSFHGVRAVGEIEFAGNQRWREKFLKTLTASYGRTGFFAETMAFLEPVVMNPDSNLARYNSDAIMKLTAHLGLPSPQWHWSSRLAETEQTSTDLLVAITRRLGGDVYLCGGGAGEYQQDGAFSAAGLTLRYQHFQHPEYPQRGDGFTAGLSVIDALMNCGCVDLGELLRKVSSL